MIETQRARPVIAVDGGEIVVAPAPEDATSVRVGTGSDLGSRFGVGGGSLLSVHQQPRFEQRERRAQRCA